ncbi:MAG: mandelate racemase/muconate lactonizing enzyme family protein [Geminicoccaceae bacterium]
MAARIDAVDLFYLAMPTIEDVGDGSQDALLVRVACGNEVGWGECEAAPLVSIASLVCPMSHSACHPVADSVLGERLDDIADIARIGDRVRARSLDLLQADHTLSGIDMALWDLLGRRLGEPVWKLLGWPAAHPKTPYASQLFGDTPQATLEKGRKVRVQGYRAAKFGWGPFGTGTAAADADQLMAAREGLGPDGILLVDAGTVWVEDLDRARLALPALREAGALWLEEPFVSGALDAYAALAREAGPVRLAGGEGAHNVHMARHMIDHAGIGYVQIDAGRVGGISSAKRVADYAASRGVTYVNHTFTSHLALSASLQPYGGLGAHEICEYPVEARAVAMAITRGHILPDTDGLIRLPQGSGLGLDVDVRAIRPYLVDAEIRVGGRVLYRTPALPAS